jgi:hypothetical protein
MYCFIHAVVTVLLVPLLIVLIYLPLPLDLSFPENMYIFVIATVKISTYAHFTRISYTIVSRHSISRSGALLCMFCACGLFNLININYFDLVLLYLQCKYCMVNFCIP